MTKNVKFEVGDVVRTRPVKNNTLDDIKVGQTYTVVDVKNGGNWIVPDRDVVTTKGDADPAIWGWSVERFELVHRAEPMIPLSEVKAAREFTNVGTVNAVDRLIEKYESKPKTHTITIELTDADITEIKTWFIASDVEKKIKEAIANV